MTVLVQCERSCMVAQVGLHCLNIIPGADGRHSVTQIMKHIKRIMCLALAVIMAMTMTVIPSFAATDPGSISASLTSIRVWTDPAAEAYYNSLTSSASRTRYIKTAKSEGKVIDYSLYSGECTFTDTKKADLQNGQVWYPCADFADNAFQNDDVFKSIYCQNAASGNAWTQYFGKNAWRNSALTDVTFDRLTVDKDKPVSGYPYTIGEINEIIYGHPGITFEDYAFADCKNLTNVTFTTEPEDLYLAPTAFSNCPNLTITAPAGGKIEQHCNHHVPNHRHTHTDGGA